MTPFLSLILGGLAWSQEPALPKDVRQVAVAVIQQDLQIRAKRLKCNISGTEIHFNEVRTTGQNEKELVYDVSFRERDQKGISSQIVKKKLVFNNSWHLLKIAPLEQEVNIETPTEVVL